MTFQKRKQKILQLIEESGEIYIRQLAEELNVSEITVRRDLAILAADGLLYRTHGGAMKIDEFVKATSFVNKAGVNLQVKDKICKRAAREINDGDIIFIDCGSTVFRLCQYIKNKKIIVITNSLPVVNELQNSAVIINMIGGEVDQNRQAVHGIIAAEHIAKYRASKAFLGVDGISVNGLFACSETEASNSLAMAAQSDETYVLCDAGKVGKESYLKYAGLDLIDVIITDSNDSNAAEIKSKGILILTV